MKKNIKIFVVFHNDINESYYDKSLLEDLIFINVTPNNPNVGKLQNLGYQVINQFEMKNFISLGKQYAESEVIYNIYKNPYLITDVDYVGFIQYDMDTLNLSRQEVDSLVGLHEHVAFDQHSVQAEYKIGYLMDDRYPNKWLGRGKNCYEVILNDYNNFYGSSYTSQDLLSNRINLCCTFLLEIGHYNIMMKFISSIIESKKLDLYDTKRIYRMQGGLLERYFGIWLVINSKNYFYRPVKHHFDTTISTVSSSFSKRALMFLKRKFF